MCQQKKHKNFNHNIQDGHKYQATKQVKAQVCVRNNEADKQQSCQSVHLAGLDHFAKVQEDINSVMNQQNPCTNTMITSDNRKGNEKTRCQVMDVVHMKIFKTFVNKPMAV